MAMSHRLRRFLRSRLSRSSSSCAASAPSFVIEPLERRLNLSGALAVSVDSGTLNLNPVSGSDGDEVVTVSRNVDNTVLLTPGAGVTLRIGGQDFTTPQTLQQNVTGLAANLGDGDDTLTLAGISFIRSVSVNLGKGVNELVLQDTRITGSLTVNGTTGDDTITLGNVTPGQGIGVTVLGSTSIQLGDGDNAIRTDPALNTDLTAATFTNFQYIGGRGSDSVHLAAGNLSILKSIAFTGSTGANALELGDAGQKIVVGGAVTVSGSGTSDAFRLAGANVTLDSLSMSFQGTDTNTFESTAGDLSVLKGVKWSSGSGQDGFDLGGTTARIGKTLSVALGKGTGVVDIHPAALFSVVGAVTLSGGAALPDLGPSSLGIASAGDVMLGSTLNISGGKGYGAAKAQAAGDLFVGKAVTMKLAGAGVLSLHGLQTLVVNGAVTMTAVVDPVSEVRIDNGADGSATIHGTITTNGPTTIRGAGTIDGTVLINRSAVTTVAGSAAGLLHIKGLLTLGNATPIAGLLTSSTTLTSLFVDGVANVGRGQTTSKAPLDDTVVVTGSIFAGTFTVGTGDGDDAILVDAGGSGPESQFFGNVILAGGAGTDTITVGHDSADSQINFLAGVTFDGGTGTDTLTLGDEIVFSPDHSETQSNFP
jgi:hypothetical protein